MAKTGTILATSGTSEALKDAVAQSDPKIATLGTVVTDALAAHPTKALVMIDSKARKVAVSDTVASIAAVIATLAANAALNEDTVTPDTPESRSTAWTNDPTQDGSSAASLALQTRLADQPPKFTLGSLISAIEDVAAAAGKDFIAVADQVTGEVRLFFGAPADVATADPIGDLTPADTFAVFEQTVESASGPKDPFE